MKSKKVDRIILKNGYEALVASVGDILENARRNAYSQINQILVKAYWEIGRRIVEFEQQGKEKAEYGSELLKKLSDDLKFQYGRGFSQSNVYLMRLFFLNYPKFQTVSGKLSWSHYIEILGVSNGTTREFYEKQCMNENWSVRELKRQIDSMLFERIALSKDKQGVMQLSKKGHVVEDASDIVRDPYILEFLKIPEQRQYSEKELEQKIIDNLQMFLLELGRGFAFVGRQFRITIGEKHYYVDLVFYNRILKCFVLIDLKIGEATHMDIGQMNMYLNYFKNEEMTKEDNPPVGIILSAEKNKLFVKYALGGISNNLFVSKYQLYLPKKEEMEKEVRRLL